MRRPLLQHTVATTSALLLLAACEHVTTEPASAPAALNRAQPPVTDLAFLSPMANAALADAPVCVSRLGSVDGPSFSRGLTNGPSMSRAAMSFATLFAPLPAYEQLTQSNTGVTMYEVGVLNGTGSAAAGPMFVRGINDAGYILADQALTDLPGGAASVYAQPGLWREGSGWITVPIPAGATQNLSRALNNSNMVVGVATVPVGGTPTTQAWSWTGATGIVLLGMPANATMSAAAAVNDGGEVAATVRVAGLNTIGTWKAGVWTVLGSPTPGTPALAAGNNNLGWVVGYHNPNFSSARAFVWRPGSGFQNLDRPAGSQEARATDVNDAGEISGWARYTDGTTRAWRWKNGTYTDLGTIGGTTTSLAFAISQDGIVAGYSFTPDNGAHAVAWRPQTNGSMLLVDLGKHVDACSSAGFGINNVRQVAGDELFGFGTPDDPARRRTARWDLDAPPPTYSLGDRVWNDVNGNGVQDGGEPGLDGVTVTVTDAGNTTVGTATTAGDGAYAIGNLRAGTYTVCVTGTPSGYTQTYDLDGVATANCASITLSVSRTDVDFGYTAPRFSLGDRVWNDLDADGVQESGETGLNGLSVTVTTASNTVVGTATTAGDGGYTIGNLLAGTYKVCIGGVPAAYNPSYDLDGIATPSCATVTLTANREDVDFGYFRLGSLGDFVWNDFDRDGIQDANEPGVSGVTVTLTKGATSQTTTTAANGTYGFANLVAGTYTVSVSNLPIGWVASPSLAGPDRAIDSNGNGTSVMIAGNADLTVDFGFYEQVGTVACTYTQGYWKNHEEAWPAPFSPSAQWMTPQKKVTGLTWDGLFGTPPKGGNSYVQLAHQWMAARLNRANGAPTSASVLSTLNAAEAWLLANTPANGTLPSIKSAQADAWMSTLDSFNNGNLGTPHCD